MTKLGLVLSGGGIRGAAHIGMLKALEEHNLLNDIQVVVGTSAGSLVGAMFALGYTPGAIWEIWSNDAWRMLGGKVKPEAVEDWNLGEILSAIVHFDYTRFRGAFKGDRLLHLMETYLVREPRGTAIQPAGQPRPLYVIATNLNTGQQTVWRFTQHMAEARELAPAILEPGLGRRAQWAVHYDDDVNVEQFPTMAQACRCSASIPFIFEPAKARVTYKGDPSPQQENLYTDGAVRDNYSLSTAVKLAGCDRVIGMFLSSLDRTNKPWAGMFDLAQRTLDQMGMTIFEADQDDMQLRQVDIRTLVPHFSGHIDTFNVQAMPAIYNAGYQVTCDFLTAVEAVAGTISWHAIFHTTKLKTMPNGATFSGAQPRADRLDASSTPAAEDPAVRYYIYRQIAVLNQ
jgi:NTE family protein